MACFAIENVPGKWHYDRSLFWAKRNNRLLCSRMARENRSGRSCRIVYSHLQTNSKQSRFQSARRWDDVTVQKLFDPKRFLEKPENRYLPPSYLERFRMGHEKHQLQFKDGEVFAQFKYLVDKELLVALKAINTPLLLSTGAGTCGMGILPGFTLHD